MGKVVTPAWYLREVRWFDIFTETCGCFAFFKIGRVGRNFGGCLNRRYWQC